MPMQAKTGLVLGCGGVAGAAWSIAVLDQLQQQLGWDARQADILIGTSAGAVLAALLSAGVPVSQLLACQRGTSSQCRWQHDTDSGPALPPWPAAAFTALPLVRKGLRGEVSALTAITGALPQGRCDMTPFRQLINSVVPEGGWSGHSNAWMMAVDASSGERVALGRDVIMPMDQAVCASYAVPGWCPPVAWQGRRYLDGGIASPVSADFLLDTDVTRAIVLAPMASSSPDAPRSPFARLERRVRRYMTAIVDKEVAALAQAGIEVIRIEPVAADLQAFGFNMMDPARRQHVFEVAQRSAVENVAGALRRATQPRRSVHQPLPA